MQRRNFILQSSRIILLSGLGLSAATASGIYLKNPATPIQNTEPLAMQLEKMIPGLMEEAKVPGLSIAIVRGGKLNWCKGFGVKNQLTKEAVNAHTVFEAASVSKTVFAYMAMKLCEKKIIDLDTPLVKYSSKRFLEGDQRLDQITARHVLSHTSGFQNWRSPEEPLAIHFNPGSDFLYSGEGYFYLQSVISELTGTTYPDECGAYEASLKVCATDIGAYLQQNMLVPFKMSSSGYIWTDTIGKNMASPHDPEGKPFSKPHQTATDMARYASAGGLLTSAKDYANFIIGLFTPAYDDPFLLNKSSLTEMVKPHVKLREEQKIDGADSWALGWAVQERPNGNIILHSGGQAGFRSLTMISLQKQTAFVMLSNGDGGGNVLYNHELAVLLNQLFT